MDIINLFDYATLKFIWWLFIGFLLIGFAIMDGHDMGIGTLLPFVAKTDEERRIVINSIGAHWEGNQTWLITGAGAIFAAWPMVYATAFSGFYWAMLAVLWAMFFRPVGFKYRSMIQNDTWRKTWDWCLFVGSFVPALLFGVALGNVILGVPFHFDDSMRSFYTGSFWALLNPFALLCGVVSVAMLVFHGGVYLMHRTEGIVYRRTRHTLIGSALITLLAFSAAGVWVATGIDGYVAVAGLAPGELANPLGKEVVRQAGAWMLNYQRWPLVMLVPLLAYAGVLAALLLARAGKTLAAFVCSSLSILGVIATFGVSLFPFILPSSSDLRSGLTVWDATSSHLTLTVMFFATIIMMPIVVTYTGWAFRVMRGKVTAEYVRENDHSAY
ncbi:cytochrome d ubiquinol oxidase subunit II [Uruburuella testudinis]|uniref:Cytochrome d ubiquinol oxidase subunit II n=1 Tax=Uruburuella testudinis TaxID=1282863 RepID=A0ABY4DQK2_9NEIS|nr:cytochrome d ubiquinol oxidase subunit II [Uruburuella testudinis]UOO80985.1 cytochrome d ubiquinol oxidase subunit II [Uruburuella testudinis]